jgi:hypothetical protein
MHLAAISNFMMGKNFISGLMRFNFNIISFYYEQRYHKPEQVTANTFYSNNFFAGHTAFPGTVFFFTSIAWCHYFIHTAAQVDVFFNRKEKMAKGVGCISADAFFVYCYTDAGGFAG